MSKPRLNLRQRLVMRYFGVKISDDGTRWTAPRRHRKVVEAAFIAAWRDGSDVELQRDAEGITFVGPRGEMRLRWMP